MVGLNRGEGRGSPAGRWAHARGLFPPSSRVPFHQHQHRLPQPLPMSSRAKKLRNSPGHAWSGQEKAPAQRDAWFHGATCSCRATWGWSRWELLRESGFSWKMLIHQESIFNGNTSNFMHFLAGDEISGQNLGEKERKPEIAARLWLKAIAGERINPCTLSSSQLGDCVHLCQRHKFLWPRIWNLARLQPEALRTVLFAKNNRCCRAKWFTPGRKGTGMGPNVRPWFSLGCRCALQLAASMCWSLPVT